MRSFPEPAPQRTFGRYNAIRQAVEEYCRLQPEAGRVGCHVITTPYHAEPVVMCVKRVTVGQTVNYRVSVTY